MGCPSVPLPTMTDFKPRALKSKNVPKFYSRDRDTNQYLQHLWIKEVSEDLPVLTDEYAPVDQYIMEIQG